MARRRDAEQSTTPYPDTSELDPQSVRSFPLSGFWSRPASIKSRNGATAGSLSRAPTLPPLPPLQASLGSVEELPPRYDMIRRDTGLTTSEAEEPEEGGVEIGTAL